MLLNTLFLVLVSLMFLVINFIKKIIKCKRKKQSLTQVHKIDVPQGVEGHSSNVCSSAPVNITRRETEITRVYYRESDKHKILIRKKNRTDDHKLVTDRRD